MRVDPGNYSSVWVAALMVLGGTAHVALAQQGTQAARGALEICPANLPRERQELSCLCASNVTGGAYGTDVYTDDSNICVAAQHAGVINRAGGPIRVRETATPIEFPGSTRNGVTTSRWGSNVYAGKLIRAFLVEAAGATPSAPAPTVPAPALTAPAPTVGVTGSAPQLRILTVDGRTINAAVTRDQIRLMEFVAAGSAPPASAVPPAAPPVASPPQVFRGTIATLPLVRADAPGYLLDLGDAFATFDATTADSRGWNAYPQEPTVNGVALREVLRERGRKLAAEGAPNAPDVEGWLRDPRKSAEGGGRSLEAATGRYTPQPAGVVPLEFAQGSEQLVTYFVDAGRAGGGELLGDFGIDNYLAVWINGEYRFGVYHPIHFYADNLPFKDVPLGRLQPGVNVIQILRGDWYGWAGADWQLRLR